MTSMTTFVKVVESGGFAAAARSLGLSPSVATNHVQALEQRLGVRLLNRSTRKVSLTEIGERYFARCRRILADIDEADRGAQAMQATPRGTLRLNTSMAMPSFLAPVIAEFTALHPDVAVDMHRTDEMIDLLEEGFDLAIRSMMPANGSLIVRRIASYRLVVCGAPGYFARFGTPSRPADLAVHNCLTYPHSPWGGEWRFQGPDGDELVQVSGNLRANSGYALRMAAVQGQGLIIAPNFMVTGEVRAGTLVPVLADYLRTDHAVNALYAHRDHLPAKVRAFLDLLIRRFRENPDWAEGGATDTEPHADVIDAASDLTSA